MIDKEVFLERVKLNKENKTEKSVISIDINKDLLNKSVAIANDIGININNFIENILYETVLEKIADQEGREVIDSATLAVNMEDIFDSNKDYLLADTLDLKNKAMLVTNKDNIVFLENLETLDKLENEYNKNIQTPINLDDDLKITVSIKREDGNIYSVILTDNTPINFKLFGLYLKNNINDIYKAEIYLQERNPVKVVDYNQFLSEIGATHNFLFETDNWLCFKQDGYMIDLDEK